MAVTDYTLYFLMRDCFQFGGNLAALDGAGLAGVNGPRAVTFVQNHDVGPPPNRLLAYAFISSYPGYPLYFDVSLNDANIINLVWIQNHLAIGAYLNRYKDQHTLIFERDHHLLAGINQYGDWVSKWVKTSWNNTKLHDHAGHVNDVWTNNDGYAEVWIPPELCHVGAVSYTTDGDGERRSAAGDKTLNSRVLGNGGEPVGEI